MEKFVIRDGFGEPQLVKLALQAEFRKEELTYRFDPPSQAGDFAFDPSSLVVSGTALLTAILSGLFSYLSSRKTGVIEIVGKSGRRVAIPLAQASHLHEAVEAAKELDADELVVRPDDPVC